MTERALIFGAGGHAHVIASMLDAEPVFIVSNSPAPGQIAEADFFASIGRFARDKIYIGIGDNAVRTRIFERLTALQVSPSICIARTAFIARSAEIGAGAVICPGSVIGARAVIGANTIINTLSSVDHDCTLGSHTHVTAGVTLGGTVEVGASCFFGIKSAVVPGVRIGNNVLVMAGALVTKPVPDSVMVGGSPAKILRNIGP